MKASREEEENRGEFHREDNAPELAVFQGTPPQVPLKFFRHLFVSSNLGLQPRTDHETILNSLCFNRPYHRRFR